MFDNRDTKLPEIQKCLQNSQNFYLPVTPNGCTLTFTRIENGIVSNFVQLDAFKVSLMTLGNAS